MQPVQQRIRRLATVTLIAGALWAQASYAVPITWTNWTSASTIAATGTLAGLTVSFFGNINPAAQTAGGINFWAFNPSTYTSATVDNGPPDSDIIRLTGGPGTGIQTLTFSAPVVNPVMAILSLGNASAPTTYFFSTPFDVLNSGVGFFGGSATALVELPGNVLQGTEGHGIIQFAGTLSAISWIIPFGEFWHGFQIGIAETAVPEPGMWSLLGLGFALLFFARRRR